MLPLRVTRNGHRIDSLVAALDATVAEVDPVIQNVFSNHVVLAGAGYVEDSVLATLSEYGRNHGNDKIARYVEKTISRYNSLNCEKIENILHNFDKDWWPAIVSRTAIENISAVDSLKTLRDQIAHGKPNGTGYMTVRDYYVKSKRFVGDFASVVTA